MPTRIRLLVLDVDGVLTDGRVHLDQRGTETKAYHVRDGLGLRLWMSVGREVGLITGRAGMSVRHRADELGIRHVMQKSQDKARSLTDLCTTLDVDPSETAVMGDDLPDLPMLRMAGYPMAVADAAPEVRDVAEFVTVRPGGHAAVREAIEHLLKASGDWEKALSQFA